MNISFLQIIIFGMLLLLLLFLTKITYRIRYPLAIILFCAGAGILGMSFLPLFETGPDMEKFLSNKGLILHTFSQETNDKESYITAYDQSQKIKLV
jgi:hypothetical protein